MDRRGLLVFGLLGFAVMVSISRGDEIFNPGVQYSGIPIEEPIDLQTVRLAAVNNDRNISVVRAQREEFASTIDKAISSFDPIMGMGINGSGTDRQNRSIIEGFGANAIEQQSYFLLPGEERDQFYLRKRNTLGGVGSIGFTSEYLSINPADPSVFFNPGWDSRMRFRYLHPFLKGSGRDFNTAPICIAQQRTNQTTFAFNAAVQKLLRDVEVAYWDWELAWKLQKLLEDDQKRSDGIWKREPEALRIGTGTLASEAQARERWHRSRIRRIQAASITRIGEQKLRRAAGLPAVTPTTWLPVNEAESIRQAPNLDQAISSSFSRPELRSQQAAIAAADAQIRIAKNGLQPDFSMLFDYSMLGLQERFDDSITTIADLKFYEWTVGVQYQQPLYWRGERADLRKAQWFATRQRRILDQLQHLATHEVAEAHEQVMGARTQLDVHEERVAAAERDVEAQDALYRNRKSLLFNVIEAQDRLLEARTDYRIALANQQRAISQLMYASGMMLGNEIVIDDLRKYHLETVDADGASEDDESDDDEQGEDKAMQDDESQEEETDELEE